MPTATQAYIEHISKPGHCPSSSDIRALCTALHASMVDADAPELIWLPVNFEDMADMLLEADKCVPAVDDLENFGGRFEEREYDNRTERLAA